MNVCGREFDGPSGPRQAHVHSAPAQFSFERVELDGQAVFRLRGEIDLSTHGEMADVLAEALAQTGGRVVLDVEQLQFIDAYTLRMWERAAQTLCQRGSELVVRNPPVFVRRLMEVTGLDEIARVEPNRRW
jgi:anti-anti-sigma factor